MFHKSSIILTKIYTACFLFYDYTKIFVKLEGGWEGEGERRGGREKGRERGRRGREHDPIIFIFFLSQKNFNGMLETLY